MGERPNGKTGGRPNGRPTGWQNRRTAERANDRTSGREDSRATGREAGGGTVERANDRTAGREDGRVAEQANGRTDAGTVARLALLDGGGRYGRRAHGQHGVGVRGRSGGRVASTAPPAGEHGKERERGERKYGYSLLQRG